MKSWNYVGALSNLSLAGLAGLTFHPCACCWLQECDRNTSSPS